MAQNTVIFPAGMIGNYFWKLKKSVRFSELFLGLYFGLEIYLIVNIVKWRSVKEKERILRVL